MCAVRIVPAALLGGSGKIDRCSSEGLVDEQEKRSQLLFVLWVEEIGRFDCDLILASYCGSV